MSALQASAAAPFFVAAALLLPSGLSKLRSPYALSRALRAVKLPNSFQVVRTIGLIEIVVGATALGLGNRQTALAVAALYTIFALFLVYVIAARVPLDSCGCLGGREAPPSAMHATLNLIALASALVIAADPIGGIIPVTTGTPLAGIPWTIGIAAACGAAYLVVAYFPALFFARKTLPVSAQLSSEGGRFDDRGD